MAGCFTGLSGELVATVETVPVRVYDFKRLFTISEYYDRNRIEYYQSIQAVRESGMDMTGWLQYYVKALATQLSELKSISLKEGMSQLILTDRQRLLLEFIKEKGAANIKLIETAFPDVTRRTLQRELKDLVSQGLLLTEGATSRLIYRIATV